MSRKKRSKRVSTSHSYDDDFKAEAVQIMLDGHSAVSVAERLGISGANLLYRWKNKHLDDAVRVGEVLGFRAQKMEAELRRIERERDVFRILFSFAFCCNFVPIFGDVFGPACDSFAPVSSQWILSNDFP